MTLRRYHRWIATLLGVFIVWTAATGVITQITRINTAAERHAAAAAPRFTKTPAVAASRVTQAADRPAPPPSPNRQFLKLVTDLHSGEQFGLAGQIASLVFGLALLFLAGSGLWMYIQMFRARAAKARAPSGGKWFWR